MGNNATICFREAVADVCDLENAIRDAVLYSGAPSVLELCFVCPPTAAMCSVQYMRNVCALVLEAQEELAFSCRLVFCDRLGRRIAHRL